MEFLTGVTILLFIYALTISVYQGYLTTDFTVKEKMQQFCYTVATYVDSALIGGNNFSLNATLPYYLKEKEYKVKITDDSLVNVEYENKLFSCSINTQNITEIDIDGGDFSLFHINNMIYVARLLTNKLIYVEGEDIMINGKYFITQVTIDVKRNGSSISGYPKTINLTGGEFNETLTNAAKGNYEITCFDNKYKNLNAKREIKVI